MMREYGPTITGKHLARDAVVYVRQSSPEQVRHNTESTRLQFQLREQAIQLGWSRPIVIDDDLGISAAGYAERPGFQDLLTRVAMEQVGIIVCIDASRLSRNSKDWAHLFELCQHFDTLIADVDQVYNLAHSNDRLVMGIKGTVSEMELGLIRERLRSGAEAKAARGELRLNLPIGYAYDTGNQIVFHPDVRVRQALETMFTQFDRCTSIRQLGFWYRDTATRFPSQSCRKGGTIRWEVPTSNTLRHLLAHPCFAGVYVYGRRKTLVKYIDGKLVKRVTGPRPIEDARIRIHDHHPGYITWKHFMENRAKIAENRPRWKMQDNQGAIRDGLALLVGVLRCGRCGSRIRVSYKKTSALYHCDGGHERNSSRCQSFGSKLIDESVGDALCRALEPHAIQAGVRAAQLKDAQRTQEIESARLQVEAAKYQADRAFDQFDLCDPKNRHVAATLEERLNARLAELGSAKTHHQQIADAGPAVTEEKRAGLEAMSRKFPAVWEHPKADPKLKKRLLRAAIQEILVKPHEDEHRLEVIIHWHGGVHTQLYVKRPVRRAGGSHESIVRLVRELAQELPDEQIARILNMKKLETPGGLRWTSDRVTNFRKQQRIKTANHRPHSEAMTMNELRTHLGIGHTGILGLVRLGAITPNQITDFAPWRVSRVEVDSERVQELVRILKETGRLPRGGCPQAQLGLFDADKGLTSELKEGAL